MRTEKILHQLITSKLPLIHTKRVETLIWAVQSLVCGGNLSLTGLGRSGAFTSKPKHAIKRMDRLLKNDKLHFQIPLFYRVIAESIIGDNKRPVILVDWTKIEPHNISLAATVPMDGRSLTVYLEVRPIKKDGNTVVMKNFLTNLSNVLPQNCSPIIVSDAGFKNNWFTEVVNLGWDFIGRVRGNIRVKNIEKDKWTLTTELFKEATIRPKKLGKSILTKSILVL